MVYFVCLLLCHCCNRPISQIAIVGRPGMNLDKHVFPVLFNANARLDLIIAVHLPPSPPYSSHLSSPPSFTSLLHLRLSPSSFTSLLTSLHHLPPSHSFSLPSFNSLLHFPPSPSSFTSLLISLHHLPPSHSFSLPSFNSLYHLPPSPPSPPHTHLPPSIFFV